MLKYYKTEVENKAIQEIAAAEKDCWIDLVKPNADEIEEVCVKTGVDADLIYKMLDDDELPRVESSGNATMIVIDVPVKEDDEDYVTNPVGIIVTKNNFVITISPENAAVLDDFRTGQIKNFRTAKKTRFLIQILNIAAAEYLKVLDGVYRKIEDKEEALEKSTQNKDLIDLLATEKTLVYFTSSLKENDLVLEKLSHGTVLPMYKNDLDLLEDAQIEHRQAIDMAGMYREILSSMSETYATIVSNNLNNVMKFLAGMTIVISVPTIISSFMGMNVGFFGFEHDPMAAAWLMLLSILATIAAAIIMKKRGML